MNGQEDSLPNSGLRTRHADDVQGSPGVRRIAPSRLITISLAIGERLPRQRQAQLRSSFQLRLFFHHLRYCTCAPKVLFETRILQGLRPQSVVSGVADWLQKATEDRSWNRVARALFRMYANMNGSRLPAWMRRHFRQQECRRGKKGDKSGLQQIT